MTKRLILLVRSQDGERVDSIEFRAGDVITRNQGKNSPFVAVSDLVGCHLIDEDAAELAKERRHRLTAFYDKPKGNPDVRTGN